MKKPDDGTLFGLWFRLALVLAILAILAGIAGCAPGESSVQRVSVQTLDDGTHCAVLVSYGKAVALDCDWRHEPPASVRLPTVAEAYIGADGKPAWTH